MTSLVYLNGTFLPEAEARISVFDRGFLMADAIYEVTSVLNGRLVDFPAHLGRLRRGATEMRLILPCDDDALLAIHRRLVTENGVTEGGVYLQLSRGAPAARDFLWPDPALTPPTLFLHAFSGPLADTALSQRGAHVAIVPDLRWDRCDIKTVQLLYASQAKSLAHAQGFDDVWMTRDGYITEGSSSNACIVTDGAIVTRPLSADILHGITRAALLRYAEESGMTIRERPFTPAEAQAADEAFATSSTGLVQAVVRIGTTVIADGRPGPVTRRLRQIYLEESRKAAI